MKTRPILIQVAMEIEASKIISILQNKKETIIQGYKYYEGILKNKEVVISLSKVGVIHTSASLSLAIERFNPTFILNMGIAGATTKYLKTKDIIVAESVININSYRTLFKEKGEGSNPNEWELLTFLSGEPDRLIEQKANLELMNITKKILNNKNTYFGKIGSGDVWNREIDRITYLNESYNILCEDMEAIATYTIANQNNVPAISIKMISDNILTGEEYNRKTGLLLQDTIIEYIEKI